MIDVINDELLQEQLHTAITPSGLHIFVVPKPGFQKKYATFGTRYGSIDRSFQPLGKQPVEVPDGIAHFLEHTLFEKEDGNASDWFSQLGASSNAYTSYLLTTYLFSTTNDFEKCLDTLLNFVLEPYFSEANVEKERGIIEQELHMYNDLPDHRLYQSLMQALYHEHPVRIDIGGTVESIQTITSELLHDCYNTFYHPENMALVVIGDVDPRHVVDQVQNNVEKRGYDRRGPIKRFFPEEPETVHTDHIEINMAASRPRLAIGFKEAPVTEGGSAALRNRVMMVLALRSILGRSSALFNELYEEGLIDDTFSSQFDGSSHYSHTIIGGETEHPDELLKRLKEGIARCVDEGISEEQFRRLQQAYIGRFLDSFNSLESVAGSLLSNHFRDTALFDVLRVVQSITVDDVNKRLRQHFEADHSAVCILRPEQ